MHDNSVGILAGSAKGSANEIVIFSVGSRSAVSIPVGENFILAKNLPLYGRKLGSSLRSTEGLLGRGPPGGAFWTSGTAGGQPASGAQIGFWVFRLLFAVFDRTDGIVPLGCPRSHPQATLRPPPGHLVANR
jgi:hypothetical protein